MKRILMVVIAMVMVVGVGNARSFDMGDEPKGLDALTKEKGVFKTTLVNPDAEFSRYTKIYLRTVVLVVRDPSTESAEQTTGSLIGGRGRDSVIPEWQEVVEFKEIVGDALAEELARSLNFEIVHGEGPDTLVLRPVVTDAVFSSSSKYTDENGRELPLLSYGTVVFDLIDGETGEIQARLGERRRCKPPKDAQPDAGAWPFLTFWAEDVAADLVAELERVEKRTAG